MALVCQVRFTNSMPISAKDIQQETGRDPLLSRVFHMFLMVGQKLVVIFQSQVRAICRVRVCILGHKGGDSSKTYK